MLPASCKPSSVPRPPAGGARGDDYLSTPYVAIRLKRWDPGQPALTLGVNS